MIAIALTLTAALFAGSAAGEEQDKRKRITELLARAEAENKKGNKDAASACLAEAWALTAEVYQEQGNLTAASEAWRTAQRYGWKGTAPGAAPPPRSTEKPKPLPPPPPETPAPGTPRVQDERPRFDRPPPAPARRTTPPVAATDSWSAFAMGPHESSRANGWHALINVPPLEAASVVPRMKYEVGFRLDTASVDFSDNSAGGPTVWHTTSVLETIMVDYGLADRLEVGLRLGLGQVGEGSSDDITVFENGRQIVPTGTRQFGTESLVGRAKYAVPTRFADLGILTELKIPLANEDDYLTSQTVDWGVSGLLTKRWDRFQVHVNAGFLLPLGDSKLFLDNDTLDPVIHGGLAAGFLLADTLSAFGQLEFNTSAFGDVGVLDANVMTVLFGGRYRAGPALFVEGAAGFGLTDESGDLILSTSVHVLF